MTPLDAALAAIADATKGIPDIDTISAMARGLMRGYDAKWADAGYTTVAVEQEFLLPILNPTTGRASRTYLQAGKKDGIVRYDPAGKLYLREAKTTSEDLGPDSPYWKRLAIDSQVSAYVLANWQVGKKVDGTLYDVTRKPGIRPKTLPRLDRQQIMVAGQYCGQAVSDAARAHADTEGTENAELFEFRLASVCIEEHERYFQRRVIPRMDSDVLEHAHDTWQTAAAIREAQNSGHWFRNTGACMLWNSPCEFLGVCAGSEDFNSDKWQDREKLHDELDTVPDNKNVLTYSSMSCFRTCPRKYHNRYVLGYERAERDKNALYFGNLWHVAQAAWWHVLTIGESSHDDAANGSPPIEDGEPTTGPARETANAGGSNDQR